MGLTSREGRNSGKFSRGKGRDEIFTLTETAKDPKSWLKVKLGQGLGPLLTVYVTRFVPGDGDRTAFTWKDHTGIRSMEMPPYYLANIEQVKTSVVRYFDRCFPFPYILLEGLNEIVRDAFRMAMYFEATKQVLPSPT